MTLNNMVWASASTPFYFKPATIDGNDYISGDNLAVSPAMYAMFHAGLTQPDQDIRVISVGGTFELPDLIEADGGGSLITWSTRLSTLTAPVKMHTMDGFINSKLAKHNHVLHKYQIPKSANWMIDFYA
jgi:predicted acylesterase/phospholipase RssA